MKLDYNYIKRMLILMEEEETHEFNLNRIDMDFEENDPTHNTEKFVHHLSIMSQEGLICSYSPNNRYGFLRSAAIDNSIDYSVDFPIFMTSKGHEFLVVLNNDTFFKKLSKHAKEFSISTAMEVGKGIILKTGIDLLS